jgi:hypothetical protein
MSNDANNSATRIQFSQVLLGLARLVYFGFAFVAVIALPETAKLLNGDSLYVGNEKTLYIPLIVCTPTDIDVSGTIISFDAANYESCFSLDFLVTACAASLLLGAIAIAVFLLIDCTRLGF